MKMGRKNSSVCEAALRSHLPLVRPLTQVRTTLANPVRRSSGWAITIHKSQGMTFSSALIDLGSAFEFVSLEYDTNETLLTRPKFLREWRISHCRE